MRILAKNKDSLELQMLKSNPSLMPILREGELVNVTLAEKANKAVYFNIPKVGMGVIYGIELINAKSILKKLNVGDQITAKIVKPENDEGLVELSLLEAGKQKAWQELKELKDTDEIIVATVSGANAGGLLLDARGVQGFLPASQLSNEHYPQREDGNKAKVAEDLQELVGKELKVKIINLNPRNNKLIFSEREADAENIKELVEKYSVDDEISGIISGVASFGAFLKFADQPEIEGMIHISELSHNVIDNPKEVVALGDMVKAKITEIKDGKISLSLKALQEDPWSKAGERFASGQSVQGVVYKLNPFGAFVKLPHDLMGLIHVSEFGSVESLKEALVPGNSYSFVVDSVKPDEKRIVLKLENSKAPVEQEKAQEVDGEKSV